MKFLICLTIILALSSAALAQYNEDSYTDFPQYQSSSQRLGNRNIDLSYSSLGSSQNQHKVVQNIPHINANQQSKVPISQMKMRMSKQQAQVQHQHQTQTEYQTESQTEQSDKNIYLFNSYLLDSQLKSHQNLQFYVQRYTVSTGYSYSTEYPQFSWQYNIHYIEPVEYRTLVQRIIYTRPIAQWPLVVRYLVFPQIYGYYEIPVLKGYLSKLQTIEYSSHKEIYSPDFDYLHVKVQLKDNDLKKLELLEKLAKLEQLKREVDQNLIKQTQQLVEGKNYDKKVDALINQLNQQASKEKLIIEGL